MTVKELELKRSEFLTLASQLEEAFAELPRVNVKITRDVRTVRQAAHEAGFSTAIGKSEIFGLKVLCIICDDDTESKEALLKFVKENDLRREPSADLTAADLL